MDDEFSKLVGEDVKPIKKEERVLVKKQNLDADVDKALRRKAAVAATVTQEDPLTGEPPVLVDPLDELSFNRPGVQHGVFRNLRLGHYPIEARLDLHRKTVEQARLSLFHFVKDCIANDVRTALITHGKSEGRSTPALLKSCVAHWLPQLDEVLAFHTAQKRHGGYGATYILLRKSERKKQLSREQYLS